MHTSLLSSQPRCLISQSLNEFNACYSGQLIKACIRCYALYLPTIDLISIGTKTELNPEIFLESDIPEEVIMAVLAGKPKKANKREIIKKILHKLRLLLCHDKDELERRLTQFEVIGELRNVQKIIIEEEKTMALTYNIEKDIRYNQGLEKGIEKEKIGVVKNLLLHTAHSDEQIAKLVNTTTEFVVNVKKSIA